MDATMDSLSQLAADRFGDRVAVRIDGGTQATFAELNDRAARFAGGLAQRGVVRGDRVMVYLPNCLDWIVAYHGIARLGAVVVPVNILLTAGEVGYIASDSGASVLICDADRSEDIRAALPAGGTPPRFVLRGGDVAGADRFEDVVDGSPVDPCGVSPTDLFTIAYTSGTTGNPKGATISHQAVHFSTAMSATVHVRHSGDRVLTALPFPHVYGNVVMNAVFMAGCELVVMPRFDAQRALDLLAKHGITLLEGVPTMYYQMLQCPDLDNAALDKLTRCTVGGQSMPPASIAEVEARFGCPLLELWGMTELAGPAVTHSPYWPSRHGSIGRVFPGLQTRITNLDDPARCVDPGQAGELQVRGPLVTRGYWNNPEATAGALDAQGWFATGDIATEDEDGYLRIVDRRKDMIITAGYNVYPAELEQVIAMHPAVAMVAVAPVEDAEKGELAKAFIVLRDGWACVDDDILSHCRKHLAAYKVPRLISFVDDLPKTTTGKIMRRALAETGRNTTPMERTS